MYLDFAKTTTGSGLTSVTAAHLANQTGIWAVVDGNVFKDLTADGSGVIQLPHAGDVVHVGLPYDCIVEPLDIAANAGGVNNQGKRQEIVQVVLRLYKSRGVWVGPDSQAKNMTEIAFRELEGYDEPTALFSGDKAHVIAGQWGRQATLYIKHDVPMPFTLLGVIPEVEVGG
jgi:hypothetical protein